jgi:nucleoid DNA-binding protein
MKKEQLARRLAKESRITTAAAADQLDRVLHDILKRVRSGQSASFPGLGTFRPDRKSGFQFDLTRPPRTERGSPKKAPVRKKASVWKTASK